MAIHARTNSFTKKEEIAIRIRPILSSNDGDVMRLWALAGKEVTLRSERDAMDYINSGKLIRLLLNWCLPSANIAILVGEHKRMSARVRLFADLLAAQFKPKPPWREVNFLGVEKFNTTNCLRRIENINALVGFEYQ